MNKIKDLINVEKYSREYDEALNAELEIIKNAYNAKEKSYREPLYSIKIPNELTETKILYSIDSDHPTYPNRQVYEVLEEKGLKWDSGLADYPRHGDTQRLFWHDLEKAQAALYFIKQL